MSATDDTTRDDLLFENDISLGITLGRVAKQGGGVVFQFNDDRFRHTAIIGRTGSGKSNLVQQMEREDLRSGAGSFILAAHEEDALYPLSCVPSHRLADVVFIDASNPEFLPRMNPLDVDVTDRIAVSKAVNDVLELLTAECKADWAGPRYEQMLRNGLGLILQPDYPFPREIAELNLLYTDPEHVKEALKTCTDKNLYDQWTKVEVDARHSYDYGEVVQWFLAKTARFLDDQVLKHIFGAGPSTVDIQDIVDNGKILIAYVPKSRIGTAAATTISRWLIMQLRDAIMNRRADLHGWTGLNYSLYESRYDPWDGLAPFIVYVDEFAQFADLNFATLLAESRKRHVGFVLSFQALSQTRTYDFQTGSSSAVEEAILANVGSIICYPVSTYDASILSNQFDIEADELARIRRYQPLARLCIDNQTRHPFALEVGLRHKPDNPSAPRRVAFHHAFTGTWTPIDGVSSHEFLRTVIADDKVYREITDGNGRAYLYVDPASGLKAITVDLEEAIRVSGRDFETIAVRFGTDGGFELIQDWNGDGEQFAREASPQHRTEILFEYMSDDVERLLESIPDEQDVFVLDGEPSLGFVEDDDEVEDWLPESLEDDEELLFGLAEEEEEEEPILMGGRHGSDFSERPRNGLGHAYRYQSKRQPSEYLYTGDPEKAKRESDGDYETVWVRYSDGKIDHLATRDEWQAELEIRIGARISEGVSLDKLDEFDRYIDDEDDELIEKWLTENCPDFSQIIEFTYQEMSAAKVVEEASE